MITIHRITWGTSSWIEPFNFLWDWRFCLPLLSSLCTLLPTRPNNINLKGQKKGLRMHLLNYSKVLITCSNCKGDEAYLKDGGGPGEAVEEPHYEGREGGGRGLVSSISRNKTLSQASIFAYGTSAFFQIYASEMTPVWVFLLKKGFLLNFTIDVVAVLKTTRD